MPNKVGDGAFIQVWETDSGETVIRDRDGGKFYTAYPDIVNHVALVDELFRMRKVLKLVVQELGISQQIQNELNSDGPLSQEVSST